jgi:hypothetical protein
MAASSWLLCAGEDERDRNRSPTHATPFSLLGADCQRHVPFDLKIKTKGGTNSGLSSPPIPLGGLSRMLISDHKQTSSCLIAQILTLRLGRDVLLLKASLDLQLLHKFVSISCFGLPEDAVKTHTSR